VEKQEHPATSCRLILKKVFLPGQFVDFAYQKINELEMPLNSSDKSVRVIGG